MCFAHISLYFLPTIVQRPTNCIPKACWQVFTSLYVWVYHIPTANNNWSGLILYIVQQTVQQYEDSSNVTRDLKDHLKRDEKFTWSFSLKCDENPSLAISNKSLKRNRFLSWLCRPWKLLGEYLFQRWRWWGGQEYLTYNSVLDLSVHKEGSVFVRQKGPSVLAGEDLGEPFLTANREALALG